MKPRPADEALKFYKRPNLARATLQSVDPSLVTLDEPLQALAFKSDQFDSMSEGFRGAR